MEQTLVLEATKDFWTQTILVAHEDSLSYILDGYNPDSKYNRIVDWSRFHFLADRYVGLVGPQVRNMRDYDTFNTVKVTLLPNAQEWLRLSLKWTNDLELPDSFRIFKSLEAVN